MCEWKCASEHGICDREYGDVRVIGYVRMVRSQCASEHGMCECEYGDVRVIGYV